MPIKSSWDWSDEGRFYKKYLCKFNELLGDGKAKRHKDNLSKTILLEDIPIKSPSAVAEITSGYADN